MHNEPSHPDQDMLDDFADESTDEIEVPDGIEEGMLDGSELDFGEEKE